MAPSAVTNFTRQNLSSDTWAKAMSLFTVVFAIAQTVGPYGAGLVGDIFQNLGMSLLTAAFILIVAAAISLSQKPLHNSNK